MDTESSDERIAHTTTRSVRHQRPLWRPIALFLADVLIALGLFACAIVVPSRAVAAISGLGFGMFIVRLFVIGHDACHGSFTRSRRVNAFIARMAFLPSLTPLGPWALGHNQLHHPNKNVKGKDYVWAPYSFLEWAQLSPQRRLLERLYRMPFGHGAYYFNEIWLKHMVAFSSQTRIRWRPSYWFDLALVGLFAIGVSAVALEVAHVLHHDPLAVWCCAVALPFAVWNAIIGSVMYVQHIDGSIPWVLAGRRVPQTRVTADDGIARVVNALFHNIMEHTTHQLDTMIPSYRLPRMRARIAAEIPERIRYRRLSVGLFLRTSNACKLYDYERQQWLDFDGNVSSSSVTHAHPGVAKASKAT